MALTTVKAAGIAADSIDETKIADNGIDSEHYNDGSIDHEHLANDAVDGDIIADNAVGLAHMAGGTDGVIITYDASGDPVHVGPGNDGQVLTSTGAGSPPAFEDLPASGVTVSNNANNRVVTGDGTNLNAEAGLTCDGTHLSITDGNLVIATSGHGIDFSATGDSTGTVSNELLDDYEEGTWDPVLYSTGGGDDFGYSSRAGYYQKVGGVVHYYCNIQWTKGGGVSSGYIYCKGFPFTTRNNPGSYYYIGSNMELGDNGSDPFVIFMANGNNTVGPFNTGGSTGLTGFAETGDVGSSGSAWFSLTVFTDA